MARKAQLKPLGSYFASLLETPVHKILMQTQIIIVNSQWTSIAAATEDNDSMLGNYLWPVNTAKWLYIFTDPLHSDDNWATTIMVERISRDIPN